MFLSGTLQTVLFPSVHIFEARSQNGCNAGFVNRMFHIVVAATVCDTYIRTEVLVEVDFNLFACAVFPIKFSCHPKEFIFVMWSKIFKYYVGTCIIKRLAGN